MNEDGTWMPYKRQRHSLAEWQNYETGGQPPPANKRRKRRSVRRNVQQ